MPVIVIITKVNAPKEVVFDTTRSIDFHIQTSHKTTEKAIAGRTSGLIEKGETVTWEATHFGIKQQLTSVISEMEYPNFFVDEMTKGAFKSLHHHHKFEFDGKQTIVTDTFNFESPLGILGRIFNKLVLTKYLTQFLTERNELIKIYCEEKALKKEI